MDQRPFRTPEKGSIKYFGLWQHWIPSMSQPKTGHYRLLGDVMGNHENMFFPNVRFSVILEKISKALMSPACSEPCSWAILDYMKSVELSPPHQSPMLIISELSRGTTDPPNFKFRSFQAVQLTLKTLMLSQTFSTHPTFGKPSCENQIGKHKLGHGLELWTNSYTCIYVHFCHGCLLILLQMNLRSTYAGTTHCKWNRIRM